MALLSLDARCSSWPEQQTRHLKVSSSWEGIKQTRAHIRAHKFVLAESHTEARSIGQINKSVLNVGNSGSRHTNLWQGLIREEAAEVRHNLVGLGAEVDVLSKRTVQECIL